MRRSLPRWARWLVGVGGVVAVLFAGAALWLAAAMSGGFDNLLDLRRPEADDKRVVQRGELAMREEAAKTDELAELLASAAPSLGEPVGGTGFTDCDEGQHNWKVDDDYDLMCTVHRLVAFQPRIGTAPEDLAAVASALEGAGWVVNPTYPTADDIVDLPKGGRLVGLYRRDAEQLDLRALGPAGFYSSDRRYLDLPPFHAADGTAIPAGELPGTAPPGSYTLLLEVSRVYFQE